LNFINNETTIPRPRLRNFASIGLPRKAYIVNSVFKVDFQPHEQHQQFIQQATRYCTATEVGTAKGRWIHCNASLPGILPCVGSEFDPAFSIDKWDFPGGWRWVPFSCQQKIFTEEQLQVCFSRNGWKTTFLFGDSHQAFRTYHWVYRLWSYSCSHCGWDHYDHEIPFTWNISKNGQMDTFSGSIKYFYDVLGARLPTAVGIANLYGPDNINADAGDLIVVNYGQYFMNILTDFEDVFTRPTITLQSMKELKRRRIEKGEVPPKLVWINTFASYYLNVDWRSPETLTYLNTILDPPFQKDPDVIFIDGYQVSIIRLRNSFDGCHESFAIRGPDKNIIKWGGATENAVTQLVFHALCTDTITDYIPPKNEYSQSVA